MSALVKKFELMRKMEMPRNAWLLILAVGSLFSLTASAEDPPPTLHVGRTAAELLMEKIHVSNMRRSYDFYTQVIGLKEVIFPGESPAMVDDSNSALLEVCLNFSGSPADPYLVLMKEKGISPSPQYTKQTVVGLKNPDTRATAGRAKKAGFPILIAPAVDQGAVIALVSDPDGYAVQLVQAPGIGDIAEE